MLHLLGYNIYLIYKEKYVMFVIVDFLIIKLSVFMYECSFKAFLNWENII